MTNPFDDEDLYGSIILAGVASPGRVTLSGHDRVVKWDVKSGPQLAGATTTLKEIPPIEFSASFYLVRDVAQGVNDFEAWDAFGDLIETTVSGKTPKALDIYHPDLADNGIKSVVKSSIGGMVHDGKGGATVVVKFQEYSPPKPKSSAALNGSSTKPKDDPNAAAKAELASALAEYQATPWG